MKRKPPAGNVRRVQPIGGNLRYTITTKTGRTVQCESHLERRLALRLDHDKGIKDYGSQPETYHFVGKDGKKHRYTPDFIAWTVRGETQIHEVTIPERRKDNPYLIVREEFGRALCEARAWKYFVHEPKTLPNDTETANLMAFYVYRPTAYLNPEVAKVVFSELTREKRLPVNELVNEVFDQLGGVYIPKKAVIYATIYHLIWHDEIQIDWQKLFFPDAAPARYIQVWINS